CGPGFVYGFPGREPRSEAEFRAKKASHSPVERFSALRRTTLDQRRCRSLTTADRIEPIHPGEVLMEDFIGGFGITQNKLAVSIGVPPRRINEIVHGRRGSPQTRRCGSRGTSARRPSSGSTCRATMSATSPALSAPANHWKGTS